MFTESRGLGLGSLRIPADLLLLLAGVNEEFIHEASYVSQSEEAAGAELRPQEEEEGGAAAVKDGGRGGQEEEEEAAMETPSAPVYCVCRRPDINCFMM